MRNATDLVMYIGITAAFTVGMFYASEGLFKDLEDTLAAQMDASAEETIGKKVAGWWGEEKEEAPISILFAGDIMIADNRGTGILVKRFNDPNYPFLKIADTMRAADITFANLEGPIAEEGRGFKAGSRYSFRMEPRIVEGLLFAGFDVLSLANNHIWDYSRVALEDTVDILNNNNIAPVGAGKSEEEANAPVIKTIGDTRVAFLAYTTLYRPPYGGYAYVEAQGKNAGMSKFDREEIIKKITELKSSKRADIVVISFHWGIEYESQSNNDQQKIAHELIDAGADMIIGHHPHVPQEIEHYKEGWIAYSLGNFVFDQDFSKETMKGMMVRATIQDKKIISFEPILIQLTPTYQPYLP